MRDVIIDGVRYVPAIEGNPTAETIARAIMQDFWGEIPSAYKWENEARTLRVQCSDSLSRDCITVEEMTARIINRINSTE